MNRSIFSVICIVTALTNNYPTHCSIDLEFVARLERFSYEVMEIIDQSNIDPIIAQEISSHFSLLSEKAVNNVNEDRKDVLVANLLATFFEIIDKIKGDFHKTTLHTFLKDFKYATRTNLIHKLLIGLYPGTFTDQIHYTDSYTETIGFVLNTFIFNKVLEIIIQASSIQSIRALDTYPTTKMWVMSALSGIAAHCVWNFEKKAVFKKNSTSFHS